MKKLITLLVAGCMVLGSLGTAAAVDVKVSGQWQWHYGYYSHNSLMSADETGSHQDRLRFRQRLRVQTRFIASETLSGMLNFEIGDLNWGNNSNTGASGGRQGGGLDADGYEIKVKWAFLDWTLPGTQVKTRMGVQALSFPAVVAGNPVFDADVAGISVSSQLTPELGLNFFYARPYDSGWGSESANLYDEMDVFGVMVPIKTSAVRMTPWAAAALIGKDSYYYGNKNVSAANRNKIRNTASAPGGYYVGGRWVDSSNMDSQGYAWWAGTTFQLPILDPFFVNLDAMIGGLETGDSNYDVDYGYFVAAKIGYKFSWGTPAFLGWYSSGDKDRDERRIIPGFAEVGGFTMTRYGFSGTSRRSFDDALGTIGFGMWGAGFEVANISFVDKLKHTIRAVYMGGTNDGQSLWGSGAGNKADWTPGDALVTSDHAYEINLLNDYQVSKNLAIALDLAYLKVELGEQRSNKDDTKGSFAAMVNLQYSF